MDSSLRALLFWLWFVAFIVIMIGSLTSVLSLPVTIVYTAILLFIIAFIIK